MTDWQAGDLALCVRGGQLPMNEPFEGEFPRAGAIYSVEAAAVMTFHHGVDAVALWFADAPQNANGERVWGAGRFIKITPPPPDDFDREVIEQMNGAKEPAKL